MISAEATAGWMGTKKRTRVLPVAAATLASVLVAVASPGAATFDESKMIIEVNATNGDAGIQFVVGGPTWSSLKISDPKRQKIVDIGASGSMGMQGLTELFCESAEPPFKELPLAKLFARFPVGTYTFDGMTVTGKPLSGKAAFGHAIPAGPVIDFPAEDATLGLDAPVVIDWQPVGSPFPGTSQAVNVVGYEASVERQSPLPLVSFTVNLPATATQATVSPEFLQPNAEYLIEIHAIDASGNRTISELEFKTK